MMTDTAHAKTTIPVTDLIRCGVCGAEIGYYVQVGREVHLRVGNLECDHIDGHCSECGTPFAYRASKKALEQLIENVRKMHQEAGA